VGLIKKYLPLALCVVFLFGLGIFFWKMATSRAAVKEACTENLIGKELSYLEKYASKNDLMFRCLENDNACLLRFSLLPGKPSCLILYSSDKKVIDYKFFPTAVTSNGNQPEQV